MPHHDTLDSGPCQSPDPGNCYQSRGKCQEQYGSQAAYSSAESYRSHAAYGRVQSYYPSRADVFGSGRSDDRPERSHASKDKGRHKKQKDKKTQRKKGKKEESGRDKVGLGAASRRGRTC